MLSKIYVYRRKLFCSYFDRLNQIVSIFLLGLYEFLFLQLKTCQTAKWAALQGNTNVSTLLKSIKQPVELPCLQPVPRYAPPRENLLQYPFFLSSVQTSFNSRCVDDLKADSEFVSPLVIRLKLLPGIATVFRNSR